jgi:hypothetical protein
MKERGVTDEEAEMTINKPDHIETSIKGRRNAYRCIKGRFLRVTFKEEADHILVITVTVRRRPFKG